MHIPIMISHVSLTLSCCLLVFGQGEIKAQRERRSADFPTLKQIADSELSTIKIQNSDCSFKQEERDCLRRYSAEGTCTLSQILSQLVPNVNMEESTKNFIVPAKFRLLNFDLSRCDGESDFVIMKGTSVESVELVPQQLTLGVGTELHLSWDFVHDFNPSKLEVKLKGQTSIGSNTQVILNVEKSMEGSDYTLQFNLGTLNVNSFLAKFGVDASEMIGSDLSFARSRLGLATLIMQEPKVNGLFSPGGGFEIVATGTISAPQFAAEASIFYLIVQDFKEGSPDSVNDGFSKPIAAIFALYNDRVRNVIASLMEIDTPSIAIFKGVEEAVITVATKEIFNINSKSLRSIAEKYVPIEGMDMISKGLTVMHYSPNNNEDVKDKDDNTASRILYRCQLANDKLIWTSPQRIETEFRKFGGFVWSFMGCKDSMAIPPKTKGLFVDITYNRQESQMEVRLNLTEKVPVLPNGLVTLFNSTIMLYSKEKLENTCSWKMSGTGEEAILDELVSINITVLKVRTVVTAFAEIYDMQTLMNRTKSRPYNDEYEKAFPFITRCPLEGLRYEAIFFKGNVLRFKGSALVEGKPHVEIIYTIGNEQPQLKVGFQFRARQLYEVVDMFYGKEKITSTWIRFREICVVVKENQLAKQFSFDRECVKKADESFDTPGIGFIADQLVLRDCKDEDWVMCRFLKLHTDGVLDLTYFGKMLPDKISMTAKDDKTLQLGNGIVFRSLFFESHLSAKDGDDRLTFKAQVVFTHTNDIFDGGRIFEDGSNNIMLSFETPSDNYQGRDLLNVNYARMRPIRSKFSIPSTKKLETIEFRSPLHIGTVEGSKIDLRGDTSREYITYPGDGGDPVVRFVSERPLLKLNTFYHAFGLPFRIDILKKAAFRESVVFAYTSTDEEWDVPEFQVKVTKGLHLYGKLKLRTDETYYTTVNLLDNMQIQTVIHLKPMRFGKIKEGKHGKPSFQSVNLFLYSNKDQPDSGPKIVVNQESQFLKGYAETVGLEGSFVSEPLQKVGDKDLYTIKLRGHLYKEVKDVEVTLSTEDEEKPKDFQFKYAVDITRQGKLNINKSLREVLSDLQVNAKKGRDAANGVARDVFDLLDSYQAQYQGYLDKMTSLQQEIHNSNSDVDLSMIDITADCIDQCKTVFIPKIEWKEDCIQGSGGQRNMDCMIWEENKEKVINVVCLLKCEAKKVSAAEQAADTLKEIRILVNRYREIKVLSENVGKIIKVAEEANEIAKSTKELIDSKTDIQDEVNELLSLPGDLVELNILKVDTNLDSISPPCLPFQLDFTIKTRQPKSHTIVHPICFNGEFYKNVGIRIMRVTYPVIDEMYKALEEAELRYAGISAVRKNLELVKDNVYSSKRDYILTPPEEDPMERMLTKITKRRIPNFTLKSDKTVLAFHHYSPWATVKRSHPFEVEPSPSYSTMNTSKFSHGKSACHQTKEIIAQYKDIADNLQQLSTNYKHGRSLYDRSQSRISKELTESLHDINRLTNNTHLSYAERRDMFYWYHFTERGMGLYLDTFKQNVEAQGENSILFLRNELSSFYGTTNFLEHLDIIGSKAVRRSKIHGRRREKKMSSAMAYIGKQLKTLLYGTKTLDRESSAIRRLQDKIETLYHSSSSCSA